MSFGYDDMLKCSTKLASLSSSQCYSGVANVKLLCPLTGLRKESSRVKTTTYTSSTKRNPGQMRIDHSTDSTGRSSLLFNDGEMQVTGSNKNARVEANLRLFSADF
jgi:hypothetical protein